MIWKREHRWNLTDEFMLVVRNRGIWVFGVLALICFVSAAIAIMLMNMISINWDKWGEAALVLISSIDCALLLLFSQAQTIYVMYVCYICYRTLYQVMITIAQYVFFDYWVIISRNHDYLIMNCFSFTILALY